MPNPKREPLVYKRTAAKLYDAVWPPPGTHCRIWDSGDRQWRFSLIVRGVTANVFEFRTLRTAKAAAEKLREVLEG